MTFYDQHRPRQTRQDRQYLFIRCGSFIDCYTFNYAYMRRQQYFDQLLEMFQEHIEATEIRTEYEIQEKILNFIEENNVPEEDGDNYDPYEGDGNYDTR